MSSIRRSVQWGVPVWAQTPAPSFTFGTAATYSLSTLVSEPSGLGYTLSVVGTLPTGVTLSGTTLTYSGAGSSGATASVQIRATNAGGIADSAAFSVTLTATGGPAALLAPSDITYLGYYDVQTDGQETTYASGLAVRRVGSEVRFICRHVSGTFAEFSAAGKTPGLTSTSANLITSTTRRWGISGSGILSSSRIGMHWDEPNNRLMYVTCVDYPNPGVDVEAKIYTLTLNDNGQSGTVSNGKRYRMAGYNDRRLGTGLMTVPATFQATYGTGPYLVGVGSYNSLQSAYGATAMGPSMFTIPDPTPYPANTQFTAAEYKVLATRGDTPRGKRLSPVTPYYDGAPQNIGPRDGRGRPTTAPPSDVPWQGTDAEGRSYWTWDDGYYGGFFIDGPTKRGIVLVGSFITGKAWYWVSQTNADGYVMEAHIFDPDDAGRISQGGQSQLLDPAAARMKTLTETQYTAFPDFTYGVINAPKPSVTYDPVAKRLYTIQFGVGINIYYARMHVYSVNA